MSGEQNLRLVRQIHEPRVGQGLLERMNEPNALADDVEWLVAGPSAILPWAGTFQGKEEVSRWFQLLRETMEYEQFDVREFIASGDTVVLIASAKGRARAIT